MTMTQNYYICEYMVTETLANGNEKRHKKTVMSRPFKDGRYVPLPDRVKAGEDALKALHYYDIEFIGYKQKHLIFS